LGNSGVVVGAGKCKHWVWAQRWRLGEMEKVFFPAFFPPLAKRTDGYHKDTRYTYRSEFDTTMGVVETLSKSVWVLIFERIQN
jgi:hypothetical protein